MINKKIILLISLFVLLLLGATSVHSTDNITDTSASDNDMSDSVKLVKEEKNLKTATSTKTIYVGPRGNDYTGDGTSKKPYYSIQKAIQKANNNDKITLYYATYNITSSQPITINKNISISSTNRDKVIITSTESYNTLFKVNKNNKLSINGLQFKNNNRGAIIANYGTLSVSTSKFQDNTATFSQSNALINNFGKATISNTLFNYNYANKGTAVYNTQTLHMNKCIVKNSVSDYGGAIYSFNGNVKITNSQFLSNEAFASPYGEGYSNYYEQTGGFGGAIFNRGTMIIYNSNIDHNNITCDDYTQVYGAGIYNNGTMTVNKTNITNNYIEGDGGGIYNNKTINIINCIFHKNDAYYGASIFNAGNCKVSTSRFTNDDAYGGGSIYSNKTIVINKCQFSKNSATYGGVLYVVDGTASFLNSNATSNDGTYGGVILNYGTLTVTNCQLNRNTADNGPVLYNDGIKATINKCTLRYNSVNEFHDASGDDAYDSETGTYNFNYGGALYNRYGMMRVLNSALQYNEADCGGAIGIIEGTLILSNSKLNYNSAYNYGGAISVGFGFENYDLKLNVNNCNFTKNMAYEDADVIWNGGWELNGGKLTIKNSNFINNGVYGRYNDIDSAYFLIDNAGRLIVENCLFKNNKESLLYDTGVTTINKTSILSNSEKYKPLIYVFTNTKIVNSNIKNNSVKIILKAYCGQGYGILNVTGTVLYNPKAKYEIYNENYEGSTSNVKCNNNWWGTYSKPTNRVYKCTINSYHKGLK